MRYVDPTGELVISLTGVFLIASVGVLVTYFTALNAMQGDDNAHLPVDIRSGTGLLSAGKKGNGSAQADNTKLRLESSAQAVAPNPIPPDDDEKTGAKYETNPKHHPNAKGNASPEPSNAKEMFDKSVRDPYKSDTRWYKDKNGNFHRFKEHHKGKYHWNGSTNTGTKIDNVPIELRRTLSSGDL